MVRKSHFFNNKLGGFYFDWELFHPTLEQMLYFIIMTIFWMMFGFIYNTYESTQDQYIFELFQAKIKDKKSSMIWKFLYFILKRIHWFVLLILFYMGSLNINHFANMMFIIFFVAFSTYPDLYRRYSWVLSFFVSYLIFVQYFFHLRYHYYIHDGEHDEDMKVDYKVDQM
jgi:hypothetical protein